VKTIVGLFDTYIAADRTVAELEKFGYDKEDINLIAREHVIQREREAASGVAEGAGTGAAVGGLVGLLASVGVASVPGLGPVLAFGPLAISLASTAVGAGVGAAAGGILGALVDLGITEEEAHFYAEGVKRGGILVAVKSANKSQAAEVASVMKEQGAVDVTQRRTMWTQEGWREFEATGEPTRAAAQ
jgi:hypothetical protein